MKVKKLYVDADEEYPVFSLSPDKGSWHTAMDEVTVTEEEYEEYLQAMDRYRHWQKRIQTLSGGRY
jgi:fructose-1,6-bisphosphatase